MYTRYACVRNSDEDKRDFSKSVAQIDKPVETGYLYIAAYPAAEVRQAGRNGWTPSSQRASESLRPSRGTVGRARWLQAWRADRSS